MTSTSEQIRTSAFDSQFGTIIEPIEEVGLADLNRELVVDQYKAAGVLLFRGFHADVDEFEAFSNRFTSEFMNYQGGGYKRKVINEKGDQSILSVNYNIGKEKQGMFALPIHGEMYYIKHRPVAMWFYCVHPAAEDGETTVCDGSQVYQELSSATKQLFAEKRLKYIRKYQEADWIKRFQTENLDDVQKFCDQNGMQAKIDRDQLTVHTEYLHSAVITHNYTGKQIFINNILPVIWQERNGKKTNLVRLEDDSEIPNEVISEIQDVTARLTKKIQWQKGEIALVDNTRILHGRNSFQDDNRELYSRMARTVDL